MLSLSQLLVQAPEHLDDTQSGRGDRVRKVTTWEEMSEMKIRLKIRLKIQQTAVVGQQSCHMQITLDSFDLDNNMKPTRRGYGADEGDTSFTRRVSEASDAAGTLVEGSQTSTEVSRVTRICRHLGQTTCSNKFGLILNRRS